MNIVCVLVFIDHHVVDISGNPLADRVIGKQFMHQALLVSEIDAVVVEEHPPVVAIGGAERTHERITICDQRLRDDKLLGDLVEVITEPFDRSPPCLPTP